MGSCSSTYPLLIIDIWYLGVLYQFSEQDLMLKEQVKITLKNASDEVLIDQNIYEELSQDVELTKLDFFENLRKHSTGCVVFQKAFRQPSGEYKVKTIYLHRLIADRYLEKETNAKRLFISFKNGNKIDCKLDNLEWVTKSTINRKSIRVNNKTGYRGVYKDRNRFVARVYKDGKSIDIGRFASAEEAAKAYNKKVVDLFGSDVVLNHFS